MKVNLDLEKMNKSIETIINEIKIECGEKEKKIIIFEAIGLCMLDNNFNEKERNIIHFIMSEFGI